MWPILALLISRDARITTFPVSMGLWVPRLSPDKALIAYELRNSQGTSIYTYSFSQETTSIVATGGIAAGVADPSWSPSGDSIVYAGRGAGNSGLWISAASGTRGARRLTSTVASVAGAP